MNCFLPPTSTSPPSSVFLLNQTSTSVTGQVPRTGNVLTILAFFGGGRETLCSFRLLDFSISSKWSLFQSARVIECYFIELATYSIWFLVGYWAQFHFIDPIYLKITLLMAAHLEYLQIGSVSKLVVELWHQEWLTLNSFPLVPYFWLGHRNH